MSKFIGEKFKTNQGYSIEVIERLSRNQYNVKFECGYISEKRQLNNIKRGAINYPYHKSVYGVGYLGGSYKKRKGFEKKCYKMWVGLIERGYSEKWKNRYPTYKDVTVCEEWHNFQNFSQWFEDNYKPEYMESWHLDKDILIKGSKIYSPETCCFVPREINNIFTKRGKMRGETPIGVEFKKGKYISSIKKDNKLFYLGTFITPEIAFEVYKEEKEKYIKQKADEYKEYLSPLTYEALYKYKVDIND